MLAALNGYKTYIVAAVAVAFTVTQWWTGAITPDTAVFTILGALGLSGVRHGISTGA